MRKLTQKGELPILWTHVLWDINGLYQSLFLNILALNIAIL